MTGLKEPLPNLFVIGAPKAGTTTLYEVLVRHPQIFMSPIKEPEFFSSDHRYVRGVDWYLAQFFHGSESYPVRGEATPWYLYSTAAIGRIAELPEASWRFIAVLRDPVQRAYSMYWDQVTAGRERRSFATAAGAAWDGSLSYPPPPARVTQPTTAYVECGCYGRFLGRWIDHFGRDRVLVVIQEELTRDPAHELRRVWHFLGVNPHGPAELPRSNPASIPVSALLEVGMRRAEALPPAVKNLVRGTVGDRVIRTFAQRLTQLNRRPGRYAALDPALGSRLRGYYEADRAILEGLIGRPIEVWPR